jgi:predicted Zn finger-like uncharacterized protein
MIVQCEQCNAKYRLDESRIPQEKAKVKCSRCQHIFFVAKESSSHREPPSPLSIEETPKESTQDLFQCPNCGFQQPPSQDCIKCGIIFSKYKPRTEMPPPLPSHHAGGFGLDKNLLHGQPEVRPVNYAGFWSRFGAYLIDGIVVSIISFIVLMVTVGPTALAMVSNLSQSHMTGNPQLAAVPASFSFALFTGVALSVLLPVLYFIIMWGRRGATLGKMAMGIKIVKADGSNISYGTAFLRYICHQLISPFFFCLGFLWMLWDDKSQTWHDKLASTCVVRSQ